MSAEIVVAIAGSRQASGELAFSEGGAQRPGRPVLLAYLLLWLLLLRVPGAFRAPTMVVSRAPNR